MKRKLLTFLLASSALISLASCGESDTPFTGKVYLVYGEYINVETSTVESINYKQLQDQVNREESFAVIISNDSCGCWNNVFQPIVAKANYDYQLGLKHIDYALLDAATDKFGIVTTASLMPSIAIFNHGSLVYQVVDKESAWEIFNTYDGFIEYMLSKCVFPKIYRISEQNVLAKQENNETFNLYIGRDACGDCQTLYRNVLTSWSEKATTIPNEPIYYFAFDKYYQKDADPEVDPEQHQKYLDYCTKKTEWLLSEEGSADFGFGGGAFPTMQRFEEGVLTDACVVYNDKPVWSEIDPQGDPVSFNTYFTADRVAKLKYLKDTGSKYVFENYQYKGDRTSWYRGGKKEFDKLHDEVAQLYISTYVK